MSRQPDTASLPDRDELLDQVLADYLRAVAEGTAPDRQRLLADHPDLADDLLDFFADQDRFRNLAAPLRAVVSPTRPPLPTSVGPYEILGEIARGGMGVVLRARHRTLGRVVALKLLAVGPLASPTGIARARREAQAVARLDHPNIVPVYDVGEHDGLPYFTMKLLGGSLAQILRHGPLSPRIAANLVVAVAGAVHHAHQRGILHRDLKPANVLLAASSGNPLPPDPLSHSQEGRSRKTQPDAPARDSALPSPLPTFNHADVERAITGEGGWGGEGIMVADFGLARPADDSALTSTGAIVGTPSYMAPEQARGDAAEVTVASDVYGLGAILYECLTGRPPFKGGTPIETLRQVIDNEPERPRSIVPAINPDLETICLKCLHKEPQKRYASGQEFADDLRRHLAGEPIRARRASLAARAWRAVRRQPVVSALTLALGIVAVAGFALVVREWRRAEASLIVANDLREKAEGALRDADEARRQSEASLIVANDQRTRAQDALKLADEARRQSDGSFRQAHEVVNDFCVKLSDDLMHRPGLQALHRQLVHTALRYYQDFVKQRGHDPALRRELADTHVRVAEIASHIGEGQKAAAAYREALAIYRKLLEELPNDVVVKRKLAGTLSNIAIGQDVQDGLKTSQEAIDVHRRFLHAHPNDLDLAAGLALVLANRGSKFIAAGRFPEAAECLEEAMVRQEQLARKHPWSEALWSELASTLGNYGVLQSRQDRRDLSLCCYLRELDLRERLARASPDYTPRSSAQAAARHRVGIALRDVGQPEQARAAFESAMDARRQIAQSNPLVIGYQVDYALSLSNLGVTYSREGKWGQALPYHQQARQILQKQLDLDPDSRGLRKLVAEMWFNVGSMQGALKQRVQEGESFGHARRLQEELVRIDSDAVEYRHALGRTLNNLGINLWVRKLEREAVEVLHEAVKSTSRLVKQDPRVLTYRRLLNSHRGLLAEIEWRRGNAQQSMEHVRARLALWKDDAREIFNAGKEFARAATLLGREPEKLPQPVRQRQARWLDEAMEALRRAVNLGFADVKAFSDEDLILLRGREDFEALVAELKK